MPYLAKAEAASVPLEPAQLFPAFTLLSFGLLGQIEEIRKGREKNGSKKASF